MSTISSIVSGLDTESIIQQLMSYEQKPLLALNEKKSAYELKLSSYGQLSSTLASLKSALASLKSGTIYKLKASVTDESVLTAAVSSSASEGKYSIKVNNLASKQSIYSAAFSAESDEVADLSAVPTQKIRIRAGGGASVDIAVDASNNSLTGIRDAINAADAGVKASVVNDGTGYRLVLSSEATGTANRITIKVDEDGDGIFESTAGEKDSSGLSALAFDPESYDAAGDVVVGAGVANMTQSLAALDASVEVDGLAVTRSTNTLSDVITGVTLELRAASAQTVTLDVANDLSQAAANVQAFVDKYNEAMSLMANLAVPEEGKQKLLGGDSMIRSIMWSTRSYLTRSYSGEVLVDFGLTHDRNGVLSVDSGKLTKALEGDLDGVVETFDAMARGLADSLGKYIDTVIPARQKGCNSSLDSLDKSIERTQQRLDKTEEIYRLKFSALEQNLSQLQQNSDFLTQQLSMLSDLANYTVNKSK